MKDLRGPQSDSHLPWLKRRSFDRLISQPLRNPHSAHQKVFLSFWNFKVLAVYFGEERTTSDKISGLRKFPLQGPCYRAVMRIGVPRGLNVLLEDCDRDCFHVFWFNMKGPL